MDAIQPHSDPYSVSVCITSYNQRNYLVEAIESVLAQTRLPDEIIVADDASQDGSQAVLAAYAEQYPSLIRPFCHRINLGFPRNKSFALGQVRSAWVSHLDGDDRMLPEKLERELETARQHPDADVVYSNVYHIDPAGAQMRMWATPADEPLPAGDVFKAVFARRFPYRSVFRSELIRYAALQQVGFTDEQFSIYVDWDLRIRLTKHHRVAYCAEPLSEYRLHPAGVSQTHGARHKRAVEAIIEKNQHLLDDLPEEAQRQVWHSLWVWLAKLSMRAAKEAREQGHRSEASRHWVEAVQYVMKTRRPRLVARYAFPKAFEKGMYLLRSVRG